MLNSLSLFIRKSVEDDFIIQANSSVGNAQGKLILPVEAKRILIDLKKLENGIDVRNEAKELGVILYNSIFIHEIEALLKKYKKGSKWTEPINVRLLFHDSALDLAKLPWELINDGSSFLVSSGWINITRHIKHLEENEINEISLPFRILVIISRPLDVTPLDTLAERNAILKGLKTLEESEDLIVDFLWPPTHEKLVETLSTDSYHAIHFDGHGVFQDGTGYLLFEDEYGSQDPIDAETISNTFSRTDVRLIVLSACQSATLGNRNMLSSVAPALTTAGVSSVVAMQFSIPASSALKFARQFYTSLGNLNNLSFTILQGRKALFPEKNTWFIPVLYLHGNSDIFFKRNNIASKAVRKEGVKIPKSQQIPTNTYFIGRGKELIRLAKAISSSKSNIVVVWGSGGIGKSSLVSEYIRKSDWRYGDGILWISLIGGKSIDTILDQISDFFFDKTFGSIPLKDKLDAVYEIIERKDILLVFDNFEDVENDGKIKEFLGRLPESCKVIITSRNHPQVFGWNSIELYKISSDELFTLFFQIGIDLGIKLTAYEDIEKIKKICDLLDGHPLAVELIAPIAISTPLSSILTSLKEQPIKGISLALDTSYNSLGEQEKKILTRISVFNSSFDEKSIQMVSELNNWQELKNSLVRKSFIHFNGSEFLVHPVIRQYSYNKLINKKYRHQLAAKYYQDSQKYFQMVDHFYFAEDWHDVVGAIHQLSAPLVMRQLPHLGDLVNRIDIIKKAAKNTADPKLVAMIEGDIGNIYSQTGDIEKALKHYEQGYLFGKKTGDIEFESQGLNFMSSSLIRLGRVKEAIKCQEESVKICRASGNKENLAFSLSYLGDTLFIAISKLDENVQGSNTSEHRETFLNNAKEAYKEAVEILEKVETTRGLAQLYTNLGSIYSILEDYEQAADFLKKSAEIKLSQGDVFGFISSSMNLSTVYLSLKDYMEAYKYVDAAIKVHLESNFRSNFLPSIFSRRGKLNYILKKEEAGMLDYAFACTTAMDQGEASLLEVLDSIENQIDSLLESKQVSKASNLCTSIIAFWKKEGLDDSIPLVINKLEKKLNEINGKSKT